MNVLGTAPAIQTLVPVILEDGVVQRRFHTGILGSGRQVLVVGGQLVADSQTLVVLAESGESLVIAQLLAAGLQGEVGLAVGDDRLGRIAVLHDQVAGVAGQVDVGHLAFGARADFDHIEDILEMVGLGVAAVAAGFLGPFDYRQEVAVFRVLQHAGKLARHPVFVAVGIELADALEGLVVLVDDGFAGFFHTPSSFKYCFIRVRTSTSSPSRRSISSSTAATSISSSSSKVST